MSTPLGTRESEGLTNTRIIGRAVLTGAVFAAAGVAFNLHLLADRLLPHILTTSLGIEFQELVDGNPVPALLDWSYSRIGLLNELREISPWMAVVGALIVGILWMITITIVNPTFHPLSRRATPSVEPAPHPIESDDESKAGEAEDQHAQPQQAADDVDAEGATEPADPTHIKVDRIHLEQAVRVLLAAGLPVIAVWFVTGGLGNDPVVPRGHQTMFLSNLVTLIRYVVFGIGLFAGYSQSGLAGRFGILHQAYQSDEAAIPMRPGVKFSAFVRLTLRGCAFGVSLWVLSKYSIMAPDSTLLNRFQALGTFNLAYFSIVSRPFMASAAIVWFSAGTLIYLFGKSGVRLGARAALVCLLLIGLWVQVGMKRQFTYSSMASIYDTTSAVLAGARPFDQKLPAVSVPAGNAAAHEFARRVPVQVLEDDRPAPSKDMLVFDPRRTFAAEIDSVTDDGLITDPVKCPSVQAFLVSRNYRSALSWAAVKYLFNDANIRFDQTAEIRYGLNDLENAPHMLNMGGTLRDIFFLCAASQQNLALLDEYADENRFTHPTRDSQRMMGDLYTRFGEVNKALSWYRKADMPRSFMQKVKTEKPLFHTGTVTGRLTWNGAPLAGVQVGAAPQRLNGLPRDLWPAVLHYDEELAGARRDPSPLFSTYHPRPFHLRWIMGGATTRADGSFTIDHLTEGEYLLVCTLPTGVKLEVPFDPRLSIQHSPPAFTISYDSTKQDLGVVAFSYK